MKNRLFLKTIIAIVAIVIYSIFYVYISTDKNNRIDSLLSKEIENLKTHYNLTTKYYKINAANTVDILKHNKEVIEILTDYIDASKTKQSLLRAKLHEILLPHYEYIQKHGVLQFHFLTPQNVTILRMHKPSKFDDDLTEFKFSYQHVNKTKKNMHGFERGKTSPSFRNVTPLFSKTGKHIGIVDVAFAPEVLQQNLYESSKIYSNFIIKKDIFDLRQWKRNDSKNNYKASIENINYVKYAYQKDDRDNELKQLILPSKEEIKSKMSQNETFALYFIKNSNVKIVSFLPIKNTQAETIAYLVSYSDSPHIYSTLFDFYVLNLVIILILILISMFVFKNIRHNLELEDEKDKFHQLSQYDPLTQLPNRLLLQDRLEQSVIKANRHQSKFSILFIDLDNFKHINDAHGHTLGDKVLQVSSKIIREAIRQEDTLARIGGDEFIVIVEDVHKSKDSLVTAEKIIDAFKKPIMINKTNYYIGASIGISIFPNDADNAADLLKYADAAMYKAKNRGKNTSEFYSSNMTEEIIDRIDIENDLREAIKNREFVVYYQPQINAKEGKLIGMEALVRWVHPTKGLIPPFKFIPLAEETGLIIEIDKLVMRSAMVQIAHWYKHGLNPGALALNLSVKQLQQEDYIPTLINELKINDFKPEWLELEITESQIMTNPDKAISILNQIHDMGIKLAVDDFGTGYSSLSYLKKLPIDKLKIDKSFIDDLPDDEEDIGITKAIIALSQSLNLRNIAEGVETEAQKEFLLENECNNIQGYLYSKPLPAEDMERLLSKNSF